MVKIRLVTLNTHSLADVNNEFSIKNLSSFIEREQPDIISLQEVNQTHTSSPVKKDDLMFLYPCSCEVPIKSDNFVYSVVKLLRKIGVTYYWCWLPVKMGYSKFDEGLSILSKTPIINCGGINISKIQDYNNWKTRKLLWASVKDCDEIFTSVHTNNWENGFFEEWNKISSSFLEKCNVWLMGDFNSPSNAKGEGYDLMLSSGWYDAFSLSSATTNRETVVNKIDGWENNKEKLTIDYILTNKQSKIKSYETIFDGKKTPVISDHYGIMVTT